MSIGNKEAYVAVPLSKNYDKEKVREETALLLKRNQFTDYSIRIEDLDDVVTEDDKKEDAWTRMFMPLDIELSTIDSLRYKNLGYKYEPEQFTLFVRTTLNKNQSEKIKELRDAGR